MRAIIAACIALVTLHANEHVLLDSPHTDHQIEISMQKPAQEEYKLLVILHGAKAEGLNSIDAKCSDHWLNKGYAVAMISMPGFGTSTGPKDCCGPFTLSSLNHALDHIKNTLNVSEFAILGFGHGGLAGVLLTSERDDIECVVATNCAYDLLRHKKANDPLLARIQEKDYDLDVQDDQALTKRSAIYRVKNISTPLFLLHRRGNPLIHEQEVADFAEAMVAAGTECHVVIKEKTPENDAMKISHDEVLAEAEAWIDSLM